MEDPPIDLRALVDPNLELILLALAAAAVAALVAAVVGWRRLAELRRRLDGLTRGAQGESLGAVLEAHLDRVVAVSRDVGELTRRTGHLEREAAHAVSRVGLVRYNPFEDTGGNQSFALALLDADGDGVVISSLHSRSGTRVYAKAVTGGRPDGNLSGEEAEALEIAGSGRSVPARPAG